MTSKSLCFAVRFATLSTAICALIILVLVLPSYGQALISANPQLSGWYFPWLIFTWVVSIPCFAVLVLVWLVSIAMKRDEVFTEITARRIQTSALLLFADVGLFLFGNIVLALLRMNDSITILLSLILAIFVIALGLMASVLSRYIAKAAVLQEESDGTI